MILNGKNITVELDDKTGYPVSITRAVGVKNNWVDAPFHWGMIEGLGEPTAEVIENGMICRFSENKDCVSAEVTRRINENGLFEERYVIKNNKDIEHFFREGTFGIHFPFPCSVDSIRGSLEKLVQSQIFAGDDVCWIRSETVGGNKPWFYNYMTEGRASSYSIWRDMCRCPETADYRGVIVVNPAPQIIAPHGSMSITFESSFSDLTEREFLLSHKGHIYASAPKLSAFLGEELEANFECENEVKVSLNGRQLDVERNGNVSSVRIKPTKRGDFKLVAEAGGKRTWMRMNVMDAYEDLLEKRALFIVRNQQADLPGSPVDGGYVIYDRKEGHQYFNTRFPDHNACRERMIMGAIVVRQLMRKENPELRASIEKFNEFILREIYDESTGDVANEVRHNLNWLRYYNFPWLADYFMDYYRLSGEKAYLKRACNTMKRFFDYGLGSRAQCIEMVEMVELLEKAGMTDEAKQIREIFIKHVDELIERGLDGGEYCECSFAPEGPTSTVAYIAQAYLLTKDQKYLDALPSSVDCMMSFISSAPDYHMFGNAPRHWDGFWFGRLMRYGDLYPQYWDSLLGWALTYYKEATGDNSFEIYRENVLRGGLCVYDENGFGSASYLYPFSINCFYSKPETIHTFFKQNPFVEYFVPEKYEGGYYDDWANDQDWSLYYADKYLKK